MNKIPTAEEVLLRILSNLKEDNIADYLEEHPEELTYHSEEIRSVIKLHVQAALEAAADKVKVTREIAYFQEGSYEIPSVDKQSILLAYPLNNIK